MMDEISFIERLRKKIPRSPGIPLGIGDDAALLNIAKKRRLVVTTDAIVENVDFRMKNLFPEKIGRKALAINLSDIAAMGAKPKAFVLTIGKPASVTPAWLFRFYDGLMGLARTHGVFCVGGDISRSKEFFASVTLLGEIEKGKAVTRSGAAEGDWIAVTGTLGGSLLRHHYDFTPRLHEGNFLAEKKIATAMIDISDGLVQDLIHILKASKVGAILELDQVPVSRDAKKMACGDLVKAREKALSDGEDFELLFTVRPYHKRELGKIWKKQFFRVPLTWIGRIKGEKPEILWTFEGKKVGTPRLAKKGFSHF